MQRRLTILMAAGLVMIEPAGAQATMVLVDNLERTANSSLMLNQYYQTCQTFNSGTANWLTSVAVNLYRREAPDSSAYYHVYLYGVDPVSHAPTDRMQELGSDKILNLASGTPTPATPALEVSFSFSPIQISIGTDYAILITTDSESLVRVGKQAWSDETSVPTGFLADTWQTSFNSGTMGTPVRNLDPIRMEIQAMASVPEPSQWAGGLIVTAGALLFHWRGSRARASR